MTRAKDISKIITDADFSGTLDVTGDLTVVGSSTFDDIKLTAVSLPAAGNPSIALRDTNNIVYHQSGSGNSIVLLDSSQNTMYNANSTSHIFNISNSEKMRIDSSGNVGIGNTGNSSRKLDVTQESGQVAGVRVRSGGSGAYYQMFTGTANPKIGSSHNTDQIELHTGGTERMRIDSSGRVGIGAVPTAQFSHNILQIGNQATLGANAALSTTGQTYLTHNLYYDTGGTLQVYNTGSANEGALLQMVDGQLRFSNSSATTGTPTVTERMRITSSGYVEMASASQVRLTLGNEGTAGTNTANWIRGNGTSLGFNSASGGFQWEIGGTERMRIDSSGRALIGTSSPIASSNVVTHINADAVVTGAGSILSECSGTGTVYHIHFRNGNGGVGGINTSGTSTSYVTSSDHRLKENVTADWDATTRLKQLNPVRFNFIADADTTVDGFLAHEVQSVVPEAITGTHNEVDDDGNPVYQGIDPSKLVPLLVKTIQELEARITALETA